VKSNSKETTKEVGDDVSEAEKCVCEGGCAPFELGTIWLIQNPKNGSQTAKRKVFVMDNRSNQVTMVEA
jgi:hypothetical protein